MTGWGGGDVTDITYMTGYYRQQSPSVIALGCLLGGVASPLPGPDDPLSYLELGCGQGLGALVLAACTRHWKVTAIDFNPAHVAAARAWAAQAGLDNVSFLEADLAMLAEDPTAAQVPEADFVSMHGLWRVPPPVQSGIVRLLRAKAKPGGAVHVSYNALPAWGGALGMQRVMRDCGRRLGSRSDRQAEEGLKLVQELQKADALQIIRLPWVNSLVERMATLPVQYLADEDMNAPGRRLPRRRHLGVRRGKAGMGRLGQPGRELPRVDAHRGTARGGAALRRSAAARAGEGHVPGSVVAPRRLRAWRTAHEPGGARHRAQGSRLSLYISPEEMPFEADMPAGRAALNRAFYGPITEAMAAGPQRVGDLLELPNLEGQRNNPGELIGIRRTRRRRTGGTAGRRPDASGAAI